MTYLVPAASVVVVRSIDCYAGVTVLGVTFLAKGSAGQVFFSGSTQPTSAGWQSWRGHQVLFAGESFSLEGDDTCDLTASGYLLDLP